MSENSSFGRMNDYINEVIAALLSNKNIVSIINTDIPDIYDSPPTPNPLTLKNKKIFPFKYVPNIERDVGSYITMYPDKFRPTKSNHYIFSYLVLNIFTHEALQETDYGNRLLLLYDEIHKTLNGKDIGIGRLRLNLGEDIATLTKPYSGHRLVYELVDFNEDFYK